MELILFFIVGGGIIWLLTWAAKGREQNKHKEDDTQ